MECDVAMIWSFWDNSEIKKTKMDEKEAKKIEQNSIKKIGQMPKKKQVLFNLDGPLWVIVSNPYNPDHQNQSAFNCSRLSSK